MPRTPDEYVQLIAPFHKQRQNFVAMVGALASVPVQVGTTAAALPQAFDLDTSIGVQLDIDGLWIKRDRYVPYPFDQMWFSFDDAQRGFDLGIWKGPYDTNEGTYRLDDELYRKLLYAKIRCNYWDGTTEQAEEILLDFYADPALSPGSLFFLDEHSDTSATFAVAGPIPPPLILAMMSWPALPIKVAAYEFRYRVTSIDDFPIFGFDVENDHISGFGNGAWGVPPLAMLYRSIPGGTMDFSDPSNTGLIPATT